MPDTKHDQDKDVADPRLKKDEARPVCQKAPEFAEHHRLKDDDQPCDDGRAGSRRPS